ncbi:hypothetical protein BJX62DRAFT_246886 [Aspergillus germanicus]
MARTVLLLQLRPAPGSCPAKFFNKILQLRAKIPYEQRFHSEIGNSRISVEQINENAVMLLTKGPHVQRRLGTEEHRAWKTTRVYEIIGNHPRLVRFLGRDPWTALPTLEKPYATLAGFLEEHYSAMYAPRGGMALQLLSELSFIHSKDVILGDLHIYTCWLQSPDSIAILGFLNAVYMEPMHAIRYTNDTWGSEYNFPFHPCLIPGKGTGPGGRWDRDTATIQTDLFLWASLLYGLLTGSWPVSGQARDNCWDYGYGNADEVKRDLGKFLVRKEWGVGGVEGDEIKGLDVVHILAS